MDTSFQPYEGAEPYIFVSYARKDSEQVALLLDALNLAGYRVWFDNGIQAGKKWADSLAEHIVKCSVFILLVSQASMDSDDCYDETIYALHKKRTVVPVYLEDVELTHGLEMKLKSIQWRRLSNYRNTMDFAVSFENESAFMPCKGRIEWHNDSGIRWSLRDGELMIIQRTADSMPDYSKENAAPWKEYSEDITSAVIEWGVTRIGRYAFYQCANLRGVSIPYSVTEIGQAAFEACASLASVVIPGGIRTVSDWTFFQCASLENAVLLDGVTEIGYASFQDCFNLSKISLPDSVQRIGGCAFRQCERLTEISLPNSISSIGDSTFYNCLRLPALILPSQLTEIKEWTFRGCEALTNIAIPDSVIKISNYAFCGCPNLNSVTIPDSVREIGDNAFTWCPKLSNVSVPQNAYISESAFYSGETTVTRRQ